MAPKEARGGPTAPATSRGSSPLSHTCAAWFVVCGLWFFFFRWLLAASFPLPPALPGRVFLLVAFLGPHPPPWCLCGLAAQSQRRCTKVGPADQLTQCSGLRHAQATAAARIDPSSASTERQRRVRKNTSSQRKIYPIGPQDSMGATQANLRVATAFCKP
jgi:hypothetical protein